MTFSRSTPSLDIVITSSGPKPSICAPVVSGTAADHAQLSNVRSLAPRPRSSAVYPYLSRHTMTNSKSSRKLISDYDVIAMSSIAGTGRGTEFTPGSGQGRMVSSMSLNGSNKGGNTEPVQRPIGRPSTSSTLTNGHKHIPDWVLELSLVQCIHVGTCFVKIC